MTAVTRCVRPAVFDDIAGILAISNWAALNTPANFAIEAESLESWQAQWQADHRRYPWLVAESGDAIVTVRVAESSDAVAYRNAPQNEPSGTPQDRSDRDTIADETPDPLGEGQWCGNRVTETE